MSKLSESYEESFELKNTINSEIEQNAELRKNFGLVLNELNHERHEHTEFRKKVTVSLNLFFLNKHVCFTVFCFKKI